MKNSILALLILFSGTATLFAQHLPNLTVLETSGAANNDGIICSGANVILVAAKGASDQSNPIFFSFNTGQSGVPNANGQFVVNVNPTVNTQYLVTVTYADNQTGQALMDITVNPSMSISVVMTPNNGAVCPGTPITMTTSTSACWTPVITTFPAPDKTTTYQYSTSSNGCNATTSATVNVTPLPVAAFSASSSGMAATFTNASLNGTSYLWNFGNGQTSTNFNATHNYAAPGTYAVTLTVTNACGVNSMMQNVTIINCGGCGLTANAFALSNVSCFGGFNGTATVATSGVNGSFSYQWSNNQTTQTATGLAVGIYAVTVTVVGNPACTASATVTITQPQPLSLTTIVTNSICNQATGAIDLTVTGGTGQYTYDWSNDGAENPDNDQQDISGLSEGNYDVTVTDANGCTAATWLMVNCQNQGPAIMIVGDEGNWCVVNGPCNPPAGYSGQGATVCETELGTNWDPWFSVHVSGVPPGTFFGWNGNSPSNDNSFLMSREFEGVFPVSCTVILPNNGGTFYLNYTLIVTPPCLVGTGGADGLTVENVYPNPNDGEFMVHVQDSGQMIFTLVDVNGKTLNQEVRVVNDDQTEVWFNYVNITSGIYFLQIRNEKGETRVAKIVKN